MANQFNILKEIIDKLEEYVKEEANNNSLTDFVLWMNVELFKPQGLKSQHNHEPDTQIVFLISLLYKKIKFKIKEALGNSEISNAESYSFLYHLSESNDMRKMELIRMHQVLAPSGIEILKRLLSKGMIEEFDDEDDKRAKRVKITKKGIEEVDRLFPIMNTIYRDVTKMLDLQEKIKLISLLNELSK
ncbi:MAG: winged helix DNA-binding protein [Candidatus Heimdallarchaeota archaeon]|nr:winged helix DNA-binding protein [Candidatus Heimdallarchaeota archaeon]